jgi:cellulose synthase/poly-beta-1,6-N-acetylglucosamine synthase-like glycosyltransferase
MGEKHVTTACYGGSWRRIHGYGGRVGLVQNVSAVSGDCLAVRGDVFREVGGFDGQTFPRALADVDLCLRVMQAGYRNVWTPYAEILSSGLLSAEAASEGAEMEEAITSFRERWGTRFETDPFHNPNLSIVKPVPTMSFPPRMPELFQNPS